MSRSWRRIGLALFLIAVLGGGLLGDRLLAFTDEARASLRVFTELVSLAHDRYGEEVAYQDLVEASIQGMLQALDPHTSFLSASAYSTMRDRQESTFSGLGILVGMRNGRLTVITPIEGTPASRLGLRAGDHINTIEDEPTETMGLDDAVRRLKGPKGTQVTITVAALRARRAARVHHHPRRDPADDGALRLHDRARDGLPLRHRLQPRHRPRGGRGDRRAQATGPGAAAARPAGQRRRPARPGDRGLGPVPARRAPRSSRPAAARATPSRSSAPRTTSRSSTCRSSCWSARAPPRPRRSSPGRSRITTSASSSARRPGARAWCRPSTRSPTAPGWRSPPPSTTPPRGG